MGPSVASGSAFTCAPPNGAVLRGDHWRAWDLFFSLLVWDLSFRSGSPGGRGSRHFPGAWPGSWVLPRRVAVEVVTTMTSADVMWQDGSVQCNIRSNDLFPVHHLDNNEFCPGDFVVDKRGSAAPGRPAEGRAGSGQWRRPQAQRETPLRRGLALWRTRGCFLSSADLTREQVGSVPCWG